jgi:3-hexulose-6-phosphate synthase
MTRKDRPLLQLALDATDRQTARHLVQKVYPHFDIAEVGTPLIIEEGLRVLEALKREWPDRQYLADVKIMDAGRLEAESAFRRGADMVTVLALADNKTIQGALEAAEQYGGQLMADLINTPDPAGRARELQTLGVPIVCVHTAHDVCGGDIDAMADVHTVRKATSCRVAVAGGLTLENVDQAVAVGADILVFGTSIATHPEPGRIAQEIMTCIAQVCR